MPLIPERIWIEALCLHTMEFLRPSSAHASMMQAEEGDAKRYRSLQSLSPTIP
jgi:hypothetical protein